MGKAGLGPTKANARQGTKVGVSLTVSISQDEAAAPVGRALCRDPDGVVQSVGPAKGKRWAQARKDPVVVPLAFLTNTFPHTSTIPYGFLLWGCLLNLPDSPNPPQSGATFFQIASYPAQPQILAPQMHAESSASCHSSLVP